LPITFFSSAAGMGFSPARSTVCPRAFRMSTHTASIGSLHSTCAFSDAVVWIARRQAELQQQGCPQSQIQTPLDVDGTQLPRDGPDRAPPSWARRARTRNSEQQHAVAIVWVALTLAQRSTPSHSASFWFPRCDGGDAQDKRLNRQPDQTGPKHMAPSRLAGVFRRFRAARRACTNETAAHPRITSNKPRRNPLCGV
jgi:hypothetical protein